MQAEIIAGDDRGLDVDIVDAQSNEHTVSVGFDGEIQGHRVDAFPDSGSARSDLQHEIVQQVRDYARWHVAHETEYDTLRWHVDTETLKQVREAVAALDETALREHFRPYFRQLSGHYNDDIDKPQPDSVPMGETPDQYREFKMDIFLDDGGTIEATSGVHMLRYEPSGEIAFVDAEDPYPDRDPDGRLGHTYLDLEWVVFEDFLDYHLQCQIRDSYLTRGADPPEEYRVVGPGFHHMMLRTMHLDCNPPYHEYGARIDGYRREDTFNAGVLGKLLDVA